MSIDPEKVAKIVQLTGATLGGLAAIGATLVALGFDPVFRPQMIAAFASHRTEWQTRIDELRKKDIEALRKTAFDTRSRAIDSQLQLNKQALEALKKEKLDRDIQLKTEGDRLDQLTRSLIIQRRDDVAEKLDEAEKEREVLKKEKATPPPND